MSQIQVVGVDILIEFLEVVFHNILYYRKLYPSKIFAKKKIYGTVVYSSQHPELNEYLKQVLSCTRELLILDKKCVKAINLVFLNGNKLPIEKYTIRLDDIHNSRYDADPYFLKTEEALRTTCLKLSMAETYLKPLTLDSTFIINIATSHAAHVAYTENSNNQDFPWIVDDDFMEVVNGQLLPIKDISTNYLSLQLFVVEDKDSKRH